jgi:hypothetical protein
MKKVLSIALLSLLVSSVSFAGDSTTDAPTSPAPANASSSTAFDAFSMEEISTQNGQAGYCDVPQPTAEWRLRCWKK